MSRLTLGLTTVPVAPPRRSPIRLDINPKPSSPFDTHRVGIESSRLMDDKTATLQRRCDCRDHPTNDYPARGEQQVSGKPLRKNRLRQSPSGRSETLDVLRESDPHCRVAAESTWRLTLMSCCVVATLIVYGIRENRPLDLIWECRVQCHSSRDDRQLMARHGEARQ